MAKSGEKLGDSSGYCLLCPNLVSHSGPLRYVIIPSSLQWKGEDIWEGPHVRLVQPRGGGGGGGGGGVGGPTWPAACLSWESCGHNIFHHSTLGLP